MKERPILFSAPMVQAILAGSKTQTRRVVKSPGMESPCPYGEIGDFLWVRETWGVRDGMIVYRANDEDMPLDKGEKWKPSIHMWRNASRITLEITNVRIERLQEISESDARAEGVSKYEGECPLRNKRLNKYQLQFAALWDSINAKRGLGWDVNPFVWVIEFKRII